MINCPRQLLKRANLLRDSLQSIKRRLLKLRRFDLLERVERLLSFYDRCLKRVNSWKSQIALSYWKVLPARSYRGRVRLIDFERGRLLRILRNLGFVLIDSNEIVTEEENFSFLNMPKEHPGRAEHGYFKIEGEENLMLRSHMTSSHFSERLYDKAFDKIACLGRVHRNDRDSTHLTSFHQVDLLVKSDFKMVEFLSMLKDILSLFFDREIEIKLRPSYFPFTFCSFEIDLLLEGKACEIAGAGFLHKEIKGSDKYQNWPAAGMGLERLVMIKYSLARIQDCYKILIY